MIAPANTPGNFEELTRLLNGIGYNQALDNNVYDFANAQPEPNKPWVKLFNTLKNNYNNCNEKDNQMEITWQKTGTETVDNITTTLGTLKVYMTLNNIKTLYYSKTEVPILNTRDTSDVKRLDGHIYIQTHWGSGVKFENIVIGPYVPPT
ncbi:MAG: hypothetical protein LBT09_01205 [Planctomycetaceae bacterium]|jgi:hypothetical protein|nr:hypothetical protein [Planctomycetaceae bacterium]